MSQTQLPKSLYPDAPLPNQYDEDRYAFFLKARFFKGDWVHWVRFMTIALLCEEPEYTLRIVLPIENYYGVAQKLATAFNLIDGNRLPIISAEISTIDEIQWYLENNPNIIIVE